MRILFLLCPIDLLEHELQCEEVGVLVCRPRVTRREFPFYGCWPTTRRSRESQALRWPARTQQPIRWGSSPPRHPCSAPDLVSMQLERGREPNQDGPTRPVDRLLRGPHAGLVHHGGSECQQRLLFGASAHRTRFVDVDQQRHGSSKARQRQKRGLRSRRGCTSGHLGGCTPLTVVAGSCVPVFWGRSSRGRAPSSEVGGCGFKSRRLTRRPDHRANPAPSASTSRRSGRSDADPTLRSRTLASRSMQMQEFQRCSAQPPGRLCGASLAEKAGQ